ncbi:MAG TPA: glycoside hydrolase family 3 N-terminal domain-containing protein [Thermoanaerobaculia bacterium]
MTAEERRLLQRRPPWAVILFRRNIEAVDQLRDLTEDLASLPGRPLLCLDQEGGPVDRLRELFGPTISFRRAAERGLAREAGQLAGEACARMGIDIDLAPVVDRLLPGASERILAERAAAPDPETISPAASDFLDGLNEWGIGGCVKHFPGLGRADLDTHKALPRIPEDAEEEELDLAPFTATMAQAGAVMISHAAGPDGEPASLSREKAHGLLRGRLGFSGAAFSDDLEMGALASFGGLPQRCALASRAGCDLLFVCSRIGEYEECVEAVEEAVPADRRVEASDRLDGYARHLRDLRAAASRPQRPIEAFLEHVRKLGDMGVR